MPRPCPNLSLYFTLPNTQTVQHALLHGNGCEDQNPSTSYLFSRNLLISNDWAYLRRIYIPAKNRNGHSPEAGNRYRDVPRGLRGGA